MGTSDKFCLRWNDFETNISGSFKDLRSQEEFFDVSLMCDKSELRVSAHKVILSACSPFFRSALLHEVPHPHPVIYLRGIKPTDLKHILDFMYHGEVNVAQEDLNSFLAAAEDLQIKGLTQNDPPAKSSSSHQNVKTEPNTPTPTPSSGSLKRPIDGRGGGGSAKMKKRLPPLSGKKASHHQDDNEEEEEEIQDITPVKLEASTSGSGSHHHHGNLVDGEEGGVEEDPGVEGDYDYSAYEEGVGEDEELGASDAAATDMSFPDDGGPGTSSSGNKGRFMRC